MFGRILSTGCLLICFVGCAEQPINPSFPVTTPQARAKIHLMRTDPQPLERPLVVVGGFLDPNIRAPLTAHFFSGLTRSAKIIPVSLAFCGSFEDCRATIIAAVDKNCPSTDNQWTSEVDVVGMSLGGLASRYAAAPDRLNNSSRRLRIARLFSVSSPQNGATLAQIISLCEFHHDMQPGSQFLQTLASNDAQAGYKLYPYVLLHDEIVGAKYSAPPGVNPWWAANPPLISPHLAAMIDDRILADIALRLRGEPPFTRDPAAALP